MIDTQPPKLDNPMRYRLLHVALAVHELARREFIAIALALALAIAVVSPADTEFGVKIALIAPHAPSSCCTWSTHRTSSRISPLSWPASLL